MFATGSSTWAGTWREGSGEISTPSQALSSVRVTYKTRFVDQDAVSPEQLLAAAHAACFNQALANNLDKANLEASDIQTLASVTYGMNEAGRPTIEGIHIAVSATVPGASDDAFQTAAAAGARGCSISRVLNCDVTFDATLN